VPCSVSAEPPADMRTSEDRQGVPILGKLGKSHICGC
jgi:hypothetical protein